MKKLCLLAVVCGFALSVAAASRTGTFVTSPEMPARFQNGDMLTFRKWVYDRVRYPREAFERGEWGRVIVSFVIDTLGRVGDVEIWEPKDSVAGPPLTNSEALRREVLRVVRSLPDWTPAHQTPNHRVPVKYTLPVDFRLKPEPAQRWPAILPSAAWCR